MEKTFSHTENGKQVFAVYEHVSDIYRYNDGIKHDFAGRPYQTSRILKPHKRFVGYEIDGKLIKPVETREIPESVEQCCLQACQVAFCIIAVIVVLAILGTIRFHH